MSKFYADRDSTSLEVLRAFENSVKRLAFQFQGDDAFNFYHEHEIAACLMAWTRESSTANSKVPDSTICLARLEWPCVTRKPIDLVLWAPSKAREAQSKWGHRGELAKELPLLAAVQIKRGGGKVVPLPFTEKDIRDLEDVYKSKNLQKPILYFLEYVDDDLRENKTPTKRNRYRQVKSYLKRWCNHSPQYRRVMFFSRDGVGFAYPKRGWLIAPLPPRTKEEI